MFEDQINQDPRGRRAFFEQRNRKTPQLDEGGMVLDMRIGPILDMEAGEIRADVIRSLRELQPVFGAVRGFVQAHLSDYFGRDADGGSIPTGKTYRDLLHDYVATLKPDHPWRGLLQSMPTPEVFGAYYRADIDGFIDPIRTNIVNKQSHRNQAFPSDREVDECSAFLTAPGPEARAEVPRGV